ncbi:MAG: SCO family protein [Bdellovibrionales bacterium]|nr:SCO family protein [Bdellovibrionales bacterium]
MSPSRFFGSRYFWGLFVAAAFVVPLYRSFTRKQLVPPPVLGRMTPFELTDQSGEVFRSDYVSGIVAVFAFVDTQCQACQPTYERLFRIVKSLKGAGPTVRLVSISVEPERDTPEVLAAFAKPYHVGIRSWTFVTGKRTDIQSLVTQNMKLSPASLADLAARGTLVVVDQAGQIRRIETNLDEASLNVVIRDIAILINTNPPAPVRPVPAA